MRTPIGARRHRVEFQAFPSIDDGMGGVVEATALGWKPVGHAWAAVSPLDARELEALAALQVTAKQGYAVDVRYRSGVSPTMRLQWQDKVLEIHTVTNDDTRGRRLILQCTEVQT